MNAYKKYRNRIEKYLQTERGKRLINFTYSIGAAIVILGAMFKLLHFPYGNELLFIGMITEVIVFTLSAFDTPIRDYNWDRIFPALTTDNSDDQPNININSTTEKVLKDQQTETSHKPDDHQHYKETYKTYGQSVFPDNRVDITPQNEKYSKQLEDLTAETEKMTKQIQELNDIYARMLKAMSANREK